MKRSDLLLMLGGILAAVAFFLPFVGLTEFQPIPSLLADLQYTLQTLAHLQEGTRFPVPGLLGALVLCFEPVAALLLLAGGVLAPRRGRAAYVWSLSGAVLSLTYLVWYFTVLLEIYGTFFPEFGGRNLGGVLRDFGSGYWLAALGSGLGLVGALFGWWKGPARRGSLAQPPWALRIRPGMLLVFGGGLLVTISFFTLPFFPGFGQATLFAFLRARDYALLVWPAPLGALLLVASGVLVLTGRKGAYLGSLVGALVGGSLLLLLFFRPLEGLGPSLSELQIGVGYWGCALGCGLGLLGAVLGLLEPGAAPVEALAVVPPTPT